MFTYRLILFCLFFVLTYAAAAIDSKDILPPEQAFRLSATLVAHDRVDLDLEIEPGYHLYRDKFKFESRTDAIELGEIELPTGKLEHDAIFGEVAVYRDNLRISIPLLNKQNLKQLKLFVKYQGCADIGVCYPPQKQILELDLPELATVEPANNLQRLSQGIKNLAPDLFKRELLPPEQAFQFFATVKDHHTVHVSWLAAEGYYLYKNKLTLSLPAGSHASLGGLKLPTGESHNDPEFGQVEIYHQEVSADVEIILSNDQVQTLELTSKFQGCADRGVCYPPMQTSVSLELPILAVADNGAAAASVPSSISEQDKIIQNLQHEGLGLTLLSFLGFGLLLAFTPCIFPMIPILSGIIVGQGKGITTRKAFLLSLCYVLASALMYTLFGILAALFGSNLQAAFQAPWVIMAFSGVFVLLALSMFGFYNLELPQSLQARVLNTSNKHRDGSYFGAAIMGAFSALIVGPCVAAPLAAALIYIGQTGDVLLGGSALFVMALGMGAPLLALGASAGKLLPKSGAWLNNTKAVFGVVMLAVAVWMLSRIVPLTITMFLTALLLIIPSIYLHALDPLPVNASGWRKFGKGVGFCLLIAGVLELIGLSAGSTQLLQPLHGLMTTGKLASEATLNFTKVHSVAELDTKLRQAASANKPVLLDFYADWCVSCKEMEAYTFTDAVVRRQLEHFVLLEADVTENNEADQALLKRFNLIGPPGIIFYNKEGKEQANRVIGYLDAGEFVKVLQELGV